MINAKQEVLCVREARTPTDQPARTSWKLPGGLMDLGEEIGEAAAREVYEETGVRAKFQSLVSMRCVTSPRPPAHSLMLTHWVLVAHTSIGCSTGRRLAEMTSTSWRAWNRSPRRST